MITRFGNIVISRKHNFLPCLEISFYCRRSSIADLNIYTKTVIPRNIINNWRYFSRKRRAYTNWYLSIYHSFVFSIKWQIITAYFNIMIVIQKNISYLEIIWIQSRHYPCMQKLNAFHYSNCGRYSLCPTKLFSVWSYWNKMLLENTFFEVSGIQDILEGRL